MTQKARYARATIGGHPIHPMLVSFPIAFYTAALVSLIVYGVGGSLFAYQLAYLGFLGGAAVALIAAVFGLIDFSGIPRATPAQRTGWKHMALNVFATILFAGAGGMLYVSFHEPRTELAFTVPLILASVGMGSTLAAGWFGWRLVQTHHVGIDERPALEREGVVRPRNVEPPLGTSSRLSPR